MRKRKNRLIHVYVTSLCVNRLECNCTLPLILICSFVHFKSLKFIIIFSEAIAKAESMRTKHMTVRTCQLHNAQLKHYIHCTYVVHALRVIAQPAFSRVQHFSTFRSRKCIGNFFGLEGGKWRKEFPNWSLLLHSFVLRREKITVERFHTEIYSHGAARSNPQSDDSLIHTLLDLWLKQRAIFSILKTRRAVTSLTYTLLRPNSLEEPSGDRRCETNVPPSIIHKWKMYWEHSLGTASDWLSACTYLFYPRAIPPGSVQVEVCLVTQLEWRRTSCKLRAPRGPFVVGRVVAPVDHLSCRVEWTVD